MFKLKFDYQLIGSIYHFEVCKNDIIASIHGSSTYEANEKKVRSKLINYLSRYLKLD